LHFYLAYNQLDSWCREMPHAVAVEKRHAALWTKPPRRPRINNFHSLWSNPPDLSHKSAICPLKRQGQRYRLPPAQPGLARSPLRHHYYNGQMPPDWNAGLYDASHAFVWEFGRDLLALLAPQPGERILDAGCGTGHLTAGIAQAGAKCSASIVPKP